MALRRSFSLWTSAPTLLLSLTLAVTTGCGSPDDKKDSDEDIADADADTTADTDLDAVSTTLAVKAKGKPAGKTPTQTPTQTPVGNPTLAIRNLSYKGSGCPAGSAATNVSADAKAFTLIFSQFVASIDQGSKVQQVKRNCVVDITLDLPQGWQTAVLSLDQRGYADIPAGGQGKIDTTAAFRGGIGSKKYASVIRGPFSDDFAAHHEAALKKLNWSKCGGPATLRLTVDATVKTKQKAAAVLGIDSLDGELRNEVGLSWRTCKK